MISANYLNRLFRLIILISICVTTGATLVLAADADHDANKTVVNTNQVTETHAGSISGNIKIWAKGEDELLSDFSDAVVYLQGAKSETPMDAAIINQKNKRFDPRILPLVKGQSVKFYNQDNVSHNVFSTDKKNNFDLGRYPKGEFREVNYEKTGEYKVYCNIHQSMVLDVLVLENHYYSVSNKQGYFKIDNIPAGDYVLKVWHIYGGEFSQPITMTNSSIELADIILVNSLFVKDVVKHKNKEGESYRQRKRRGGGY